MSRAYALTDDERLAHEVGRGVRALRMRAGLSGLGLAKRAGLTHSTVYRIEAGSLLCRLPTYASIAKALGCTVEDLLREGRSPTDAGSVRVVPR